MKIAAINKISAWESKPLNRDIALKDLIITGFVSFISYRYLLRIFFFPKNFCINLLYFILIRSLT